MQLPKRLSSRRLTLLSPESGFAEALQQTLNQNYDFHRTFLDWVKPDWSVDEVRQNLHLARKDWNEVYGEKRYFVFLRGGELVGCLGLRPTSPPAFNLGYWMAEPYARQGLMKEALETVIAWLGEYPLWLTTAPSNTASQRLAESLGFICTHRADGADAHWRYALNHR